MKKEDSGSKTAKKIIKTFEEDVMKENIKKEVIRLLEENQEKEEIEVVRKLKLQYSKNFFVRFPRDMEKILELKKGRKIKFFIKINPKNSNKKVDVRLEVVE